VLVTLNLLIVIALVVTADVLSTSALLFAITKNSGDFFDVLQALHMRLGAARASPPTRLYLHLKWRFEEHTNLCVDPLFAIAKKSEML